MNEPDLDSITALRAGEPQGKPIQMGIPGRDGHATLLHSFLGALNADAAWLVVNGGPGGAVSPLSAWDPEGLGEPQGWLGGRFLPRLLESKGSIVEFEDEADGRAAGPGSPADSRIACAVGARVQVPEAAGAAICAGFAAHPLEDREHLLWATDLFSAVAALQLQDIGGFARVIRGSLHDSLTGCLTYGGLIDAIDSEIIRSTRRGHLLSCCFFDLDDFKDVNKRRGHLVGNRVLAEVGEALRTRIRPYDIIGRFGGDEFVALLPETGETDANLLAERLRRAVHKPAGSVAEMPVDVSFGVAEWSEGMSTQDLLESADRALRIAKSEEPLADWRRPGGYPSTVT
jgi:diguanylate cyclase (GGDEF)-like protein